MGLKKITAGLALAAFTSIGAAQGQTTDLPKTPTAPAAANNADSALRYANALHLAYIVSPSAAVNDVSKRGLDSLALALAERTAVEPRGVAAVNVEKDDLTFFPFIYWPVLANTPAMSPAARNKVQKYLNHGGMIVFDTRDEKALRTILDDLSLNPLVEIGRDHSLTKTFYLVSALPGSTRSGQVLVEAPDQKTGDMSSVIVGPRNWAGAWSATTVGPSSREREDALRSGINMVLFALTGTYKQDQIHIPTILEKLGRNGQQKRQP